MKNPYLLRLLALLGLLTLATAARAQNVGIGTTAPTQTLDVNGTLRVRAAAGSGTGRLLGVSADGTLQAQSAPFGATATATPQALVSLGTVSTGSNPISVAVNLAGTRAYVVNQGDNTLQTYDLTGSAPISLGTVGTGSNPISVAVNPAGTRAYVVNLQSNTLQTYDLTSSTPISLGTVGTGNNPFGVAVNSAGTRAYVVNLQSNTLQTYDLTGSTPVSLGTVATGGFPISVAVNPAGTRAYVVNENDNTLQTYDLAGSLPVSLGTAGTGNDPAVLAVNPAGTRAYVVNNFSNTLQMYDLTGGTPVSLGTAGTGSNPYSVAVNPAGTRAYVVNFIGSTLQTFVIGSPRLVAVGADGTLGSLDPATLPSDNLGNHTATQNLDLATYQLVGNGGSQGLTISNTGNVGIGLSAPIAKLHVSGGVSNSFAATGPISYFTATSGFQSNRANPAVTRTVCAYFEGGNVFVNDAIHAGQLSVASDARIKHVVGRSRPAADLALLQQLRITDYTYLDPVAHGSQVTKKVIAQEVEAVLPAAVSRSTQALPNVYARATAVTFAAGTVTLTCPTPHGLPAAGGRLRLYTPANEELSPAVTVVDARTVRFASTQAYPEGLFVYGQYVDDFRSVDYDALTTLTVSATQELARQLAELRAQNAALQARLAALQAQQAAATRRTEQAGASLGSFEQRLRALEAAGAQASK